MSKTPFEVRLETLHLAFGILRDQYEAKDPHNKTSPSTEEILKLAGTLREFVCDGEVDDIVARMKNESPKKQILNEGEAKRKAFLDSIKPEGDCCGAFETCECRTELEPGNNGC